MMQAHNTDYLSRESLAWFPRLGIHAANIAPEFGVQESRALVEILCNYGLHELKSKFLNIAYNSMQWKKWTIRGNDIDNESKSLMCGHYIFSTKELMDFKSEASSELRKNGVDLDSFLKDQIKKSIFKYLYSFRLIL